MISYFLALSIPVPPYFVTYMGDFRHFSALVLHSDVYILRKRHSTTPS